MKTTEEYVASAEQEKLSPKQQERVATIKKSLKLARKNFDKIESVGRDRFERMELNDVDAFITTP